MITSKDRYRGALLGLATGDAVGTTLEFRPPGTFEPISDLVGGGPFLLRPGEWTDDTSMALCLATSLIETARFDPIDQLERYCRWQEQGYLSSNGRCFDIGGTSSSALARFRRTREPWCGSTAPYAAGNGSIMRLVPVVLSAAGNPARAIELAAKSSRTTHGAPTAVDGCRYLAALVLGALQGEPKEVLLAENYCPVEDLWQRAPLDPEIGELAMGSFKRRRPPQIAGTGYVVRSLEAAIWAFFHSGSFQEGCLLAANLGDDADTTAAVYGQLAGAYYGASGIPEHWLNKLVMRAEMEAMSDALLELSLSGGPEDAPAASVPFPRSEQRTEP